MTRVSVQEDGVTGIKGQSVRLVGRGHQSAGRQFHLDQVRGQGVGPGAGRAIEGGKMIVGQGAATGEGRVGHQVVVVHRHEGHRQEEDRRHGGCRRRGEDRRTGDRIFIDTLIHY